jgi:hypothetical protein
MSFEIEGKLIEKFETVVVSDKFQKREFVIQTEENANGSIYTEDIKFQTVQAKCDSLNYVNVGDNIKVSFNIKGRKWEKEGKVSYFTNLDAWRVEKVGEASNSQPNTYTPPTVEVVEDSSDSLPF